MPSMSTKSGKTSQRNNYTSLSGSKISSRGAKIVLSLLMLPVLVGGVYVAQQYFTSASESCPPTNIQTERTSNTSAVVSFSTTCETKAEIYCSVGEDGVQFFCGEDANPTMNHIINTQDVTLNTDVPYYVYIETGMENRAQGYVSASPTDVTFGLDFSVYDDETIIGITSEDPAYDPAYDINQDGMINMLDRAEFYEN